ncbi:hypothetical protein DN390_18890 [Bacillus sp. SH7-1]|uniref:Uncharacterized protein n=1 Tax=Bacillus cereus TaxID=1396 RepID=A0A2A8Y9Y5_BACCE|nr:hypothetical protein CN291_26025 [Bacillus cereus]TXR98369.1 hypothetical protein DN390_18890 [Bacillus sp. SH7-1]PFC77906.1 hypothetical protein CN290_01915 [Bacillus cereus]PFD68914.1 hypothetical protein CN301_25615 [Bacillus cereus]PFR44691.1 hypothetical protein COK35_30220 [Bacillus cereus]
MGKYNKEVSIKFRTKEVNEMKRSLAARAKFLDYIYFCRAIFHDVIVNGIRLSFFNNCIVAIER